MPTSIGITGLSAFYPIPGVFPEIAFAQGQGSSGTATYGALLICNKTTAGSGTADTVIYGPDTVTPLATQADADAIGGPGSELSRGFRRFVKFNQVTPVYAILVAESAGAAATGTITLTTTATGTGTLRIYKSKNDFVDVLITSGSTPTNVADAATLAVNSRTDWPFTCGNAAGVITLTAKNKGPRGNWLRYWSRIFPSCGMTTSTATPAYFTGGATADVSTTALATILSRRFYWIVSAAEDATQVGALKTQLAVQALATNNIRQMAFFGSNDTQANATTVATGINHERLSAPFLAQSDYTPFEMACQTAALVSLGAASTIPRCNYDNLGLTSSDPLSALWEMDAPMSGAAPTQTQIASALNSGLSPIGVTSSGKTYLVSPITTRSLNGSNPDYQTRDICKVFISDFYTDDLATKLGIMMVGKNIAADPIGNAPVPGGDTITPRVPKAATNRLSQDYFDRGLVENIDDIKGGTICIRETNPTTRLSIQVPLDVADPWHQTGIKILQVG